MEHRTQSIAVVGNGYVGTVVSACFAELGHHVIGLENDPTRLEALRSGQVPFYEPGLGERLQAGLSSGRLVFTDDVKEAMDHSDVVFLCVNTPSGPDGRADMHAVEVALRSIAETIERHHILVTKSTVPIGTAPWLATLVEDSLPEELLAEAAFSVVSNPEFLREGTAVNDFLHPDRVVLGSDDPAALETVASLYRPILDQSFPEGDPGHRPSLVRTSLATAETVKYASNAFLAAKISFINEIANISEMVGADVTEVALAMGLDPRIGSRFLEAGIGWGGSCFGKDLDALVATAEEHGYEPSLLRAVVSVNRRQRGTIVEKIRRELKGLRGRRIGLLGLAFKSGTDDLRDSPAIDVAHRLISEGAVVTAFDPMVKEVAGMPGLRIADDAFAVAVRAQALVVATDWPDFLSLDLPALLASMRGDLFVDGRNLFDPLAVIEAGFRYEGVGRVAPALDHSLQS